MTVLEWVIHYLKSGKLLITGNYLLDKIVWEWEEE